jgi:hypothetical protein
MSQLMKLREVKDLATRLTGLCGGVASAYLPAINPMTPACGLREQTDPALATTDGDGMWMLKFRGGQFGVNAGLVRDRLQSWGEVPGLASLMSESRYWDTDPDVFANQVGTEVTL